MNDIPRGTTRVKLLNFLLAPSHRQNPSGKLHPDVYCGAIITDSRLDDELSVATLQFSDTPVWLNGDPCGFPKKTALGTLWESVDTSAVDDDGRTEFIRAVKAGENLHYAEMLAEFKDTDVNVQDKQGRSALHWACSSGHPVMVELCLSVPNCDVGLRDNENRTAFDISLHNGNQLISALFYQNVFDIEEYDPPAALLRQLTVTSEPPKDQVVFPGVAMFAPIETRNEPLVAALINRGVDLSARNQHGDTALHVATAIVGNAAIASRLLEAGSDVNAIGNAGATPLHQAVHDKEMVELLLGWEADIEVKDTNNRTALNWARQNGQLDVSQLLLDREADARAKATDVLPAVKVQEVHQSAPDQTTPRPEAAKGYTEVAKTPPTGEASTGAVSGSDRIAPHPEAVKTPPAGGVSTAAVPSDNRTAPHMTAAKQHTEMAKTLLAGGASADALSGGNRTGRYLTAENRHTEVNTLPAGRASIDAVSDDNWTALHRAAEKGDSETVQKLIAGGASLEAVCTHERTALHLAVENGHADVVKILLDGKASTEAVCFSSQTALHLAAERGYTEIVNILLAGRASTEAVSGGKKTALHLAAINGHTEIVEKLLDGGASVEAVSTFKRTALHIAAKNGHTEMVRVLLAHRASTEAICYGRWTALHLAVQNGDTETVKVLEAHDPAVLNRRRPKNTR